MHMSKTPQFLIKATKRHLKSIYDLLWMAKCLSMLYLSGNIGNDFQMLNQIKTIRIIIYSRQIIS